MLFIKLCLLDVLRSPGSHTFSAFFSAAIPNFSGEEIDGDISFTTKSSKVSLSLDIVQWWVSVFVPIYYRRKFL